jgi:hypothetical protein
MNATTPLIVTALVLVGCTVNTSGPTPVQQMPTIRQVDVSGMPDYPLDNVPTTPVSPQFVLEHRSALNGTTVRLRGTVVRMIGPDGGSSPTGGVAPLPGAHIQPRVFLAAGPAVGGQTAPELMLLLKEDDPGFPAGQIIEVDAAVEASAVAIVVTRVYPRT